MNPLYGPLLENVAERFWSKVDVREDRRKCWLYRGWIDRDGYGSFGVGGRKGRNVGAHRVAYWLTFGPLRRGMNIDHLCHAADSSCRGDTTCIHRRCANPYHLEEVTIAVNSRRSNKAAQLRQMHRDRKG